MISHVNSFPGISSDFTIFFIALNSHMNTWLWMHIWFHYHEFTGMNSGMNSYTCILTYDFTIFFMILYSYLNSYYEFISDFMIMNSYATFHNLWIHMRIYLHEEYHEIIPDIMCSKVPDAQSLPMTFKFQAWVTGTGPGRSRAARPPPPPPPGAATAAGPGPSASTWNRGSIQAATVTVTSPPADVARASLSAVPRCTQADHETWFNVRRCPCQPASARRWVIMQWAWWHLVPAFPLSFLG